jgi:hypothetical protein
MKSQIYKLVSSKNLGKKKRHYTRRYMALGIPLGMPLGYTIAAAIGKMLV